MAAYKPASAGIPARKAYAITCGTVIKTTTVPATRSDLKRPSEYFGPQVITGNMSSSNLFMAKK
jgi:hypothetical protein